MKVMKLAKRLSLTPLIFIIGLLFSLPTSLLAAETPYIGEISMFAGNFAPRGWAFCDGQLLPIAQYSALFALLGTTYGGDGRTTFALPDLRGRAPIHAGTGPGLSERRLGSKAGQETTTLTVAQMPNHNHGAYQSINTAEGTQSTPTSGYPAKTGDGSHDYANATDAQATNVTVGNTGGGQAHDNMQPFLTINYIIALQGIFPSRN